MTAAALPDEAAAFLRECCGDQWTVEPLPGDASVRRYYRIRFPNSSSQMLAYYPHEVRAQLKQFLDAYQAILEQARVPKVLHYSDAAVLQLDVGDETLFDLLHRDRQRGVRLYREAIDALVTFQRAGEVTVNPPFSSDFFFKELEMTGEFYVEKLMGQSESRRLLPIFRRLTDKLQQHPYMLCHRDYHGQNIHIVNDSLFIIDYQDLRLGPDTYDMASLLRDRGVARILGEETELELLEYYGRAEACPASDLRRRYFETLLQRSIKIIGTFSRQPIERGRIHYLEFIPPTLESVECCLSELPEFEELTHIFPLQFSLDQARRRVEGMIDASAQNHAASR
ncbi:MAG TPA: phosphotransferase [Thermoanaerobaculia bacterium]|nr:phosphotransferase [Thermoanaerobaculia bacterium]